jgi:hypothetical protein
VPVRRGRKGVIGLLEQAHENRGEQSAETPGGFTELVERGLAAAAGVEVSNDLLAAWLPELPVQMGREERQQLAALLGQRCFLVPAEPEVPAQSLAGAENQPGDHRLVEPDALADLFVASRVELAQAQDEPLARRELRAWGPDRPLRGLARAGLFVALLEGLHRAREEIRGQAHLLRVARVQPGQRANQCLLDEVGGRARVAG